MKKRSIPSIPSVDSERKALRRRIKQLDSWFHDENWDACYSLIDPKLAAERKVELATYSAQMQAIKNVYGSVNPWFMRLSLHLETSANQRDKRPFAYVYLFWQDDAHGFHMFRERWVKDNGKWYTRVVGLVSNRQEAGSMRD